MQQLAAGATTLVASTVLTDLSSPRRSRAEEGAAKSLFILGWDGAGLNNVLPMINDGRLPNLKRFIETGGGRLCPIQLTGYTLTVPSWSEMFTGLTHDQTGILGNHQHDLSTGLIMNRNPHPYLPSFEQRNGVFGDFRVWYEEVRYEHSILKPIQEIGYKVGFFVSKKFLANVEGKPFRAIGASISACELYSPAYRPETGVDGDYLPWLQTKAFEFMEGAEKHVTFLHLNPDIYGHIYGEASDRYREEFIRCDDVLGQLLARLDPANTNVIVVSDHGFDPGEFNHDNAPDAWMVTDLPIHPIFVHQENQRAFGTMRDVAHTILDHFGIPFSSMPLQMRGVSLLE